MPDSTKRRLERLADDANELMRLSDHVFGFILIVGPKGTCIRDDNTWLAIGKLAAIPGDLTPVWIRDYQVETGFTEPRCIWWWGNPRGVDQFKQWAERLALLLEDAPTLLGGIGAEWGLFGIMCALCMYARKQPELSDFVRELVVRVPDTLLRRSEGLSDEKIPKNKVYMMQVIIEGASFAHKVASYMLGQLPREPRLTVNRDEKTVTLDGTPYRPFKEIVIILDVLHKANGERLSMSTIQDREPELGYLDRFTHLLNKMKKRWPELYEVIVREGKKGYRIRKEYLA